MSELAASPAKAFPQLRLSAEAVLAACIAFGLGLQAWLALAMEINWDEFHYLSQIYEFQRGELMRAPQSFHVHLFGWLTSIAGGEIRQIEFGRAAMLLCEIGTCGLIYALSRRFFDRAASLFAVLGYVTAGFTIIHGASFRADPLAAMLTMTALALVSLAPTRRSVAVAIGLTAALAVLVTAKSIFYAPAFVAVAAWRWREAADRKRVIRWLVESTVSAVIACAAFYFVHLWTLPQASNVASRAMIGGAARTALLEGGLAPRAMQVAQWAILSPIQAMLIAGGIAGAVVCLARSQPLDRARAALVVLCAAPLLSLLFYRNAFPYFFAFILPPASLLFAWSMEQWKLLRKFALPLALCLTMLAAKVAVEWSRNGQRAQTDIISSVHRMFPQPVPYIDRNGMIASFPKRGIFMSTWGLQTYRRGPPLFADLLARETIPLLIVNGASLEDAVGIEITGAPGIPLHAADRKVLRDNYVPHWGSVWVAGKTVRLGRGPSEIWIGVPGTYSVEGAAVSIDGRMIPANGAVHLDRGAHILRAKAPAQIRLRWGERLYRPVQAPPSEPVYWGF